MRGVLERVHNSRTLVMHILSLWELGVYDLVSAWLKRFVQATPNLSKQLTCLLSCSSLSSLLVALVLLLRGYSSGLVVRYFAGEHGLGQVAAEEGWLGSRSVEFISGSVQIGWAVYAAYQVGKVD
jgi:hypothetical protein